MSDSNIMCLDRTVLCHDNQVLYSDTQLPCLDRTALCSDSEEVCLDRKCFVLRVLFLEITYHALTVTYCVLTTNSMS